MQIWRLLDSKPIKPMTRVQVSSSQVIDQLWFVKGINGEMSKHTTKQNDNIGTTPICQMGKF